MAGKTITKPYPPELRERAVRVVREHEGTHASRWAAIQSVAEKVGCNAEPLRRRARQDVRDTGRRGGLTSDERSRPDGLERDVRELRQANETLRKASAHVAMAELDAPYMAPVEEMIAFVPRVLGRSSRGVRGGADLPRAARLQGVLALSPLEIGSKASAPAQTDTVLRGRIRRVWEENRRVYGVRKIWRQRAREGIRVARCTVARLMRQMGIQGIVRGARVKTTVSNNSPACPPRPGEPERPGRRTRTRSAFRTSPTSRPGTASSTSPS
jgi:transposase-like protein